MNDTTIVLVPIRYPLTAQSAQTLTKAKHIASDYDSAYLFILHVNVFQYSESVKVAEVRQAVEPVLDNVTFSVTTRQGFLVEEIILDEAKQLNADAIVVGEKQIPWWKRLFDRIFRNTPDITSYLRKNSESSIEVISVK